MARHFVTDGNIYSICEEKGETDVFAHGDTIVTGPQPDSYCTACREADPEWIHLEDEEYFKLAQEIF